MENDAERDFTYYSTENPDAHFAGTGGVGGGLTSPETGGDPGESDLTAGGTGTAVNSGEDSGGAAGSGGGVVDRVDGPTTVGGIHHVQLEDALKVEQEIRELEERGDDI